MFGIYYYSFKGPLGLYPSYVLFHQYTDEADASIFKALAL